MPRRYGTGTALLCAGLGPQCPHEPFLGGHRDALPRDRGAAPLPIPIIPEPCPACVAGYGQNVTSPRKALFSSFQDLSHQRDPAIPTKPSLSTLATKIERRQLFRQLQAGPQLY